MKWIDAGVKVGQGGMGTGSNLNETGQRKMPGPSEPPFIQKHGSFHNAKAPPADSTVMMGKMDPDRGSFPTGGAARTRGASNQGTGGRRPKGY